MGMPTGRCGILGSAAARACGTCTRALRSALVASLLAFALTIVPAGPARADELADVRSELQAKLAEADSLASDMKDAQGQIESLEAEIKGILADIAQKQEERTQLQRHGGDLVKAMYKNRSDLNLFFIFSECDTLSEVMARMEMRERVAREYSAVLDQVAHVEDELQESYRQASLDKDVQAGLVEDMRSKQKELDAAIADLRKREEQLNAEEKAKLAQAAAAAHQVAATFDTGTDFEGAGEWRTGEASAYGGSSDSMTPNPGTTATGTVCDDWSVGVAVPLSWGPSAYYGKQVEISYGGKSIIAPVVDCGGMDGVVRHLDLQPGVFKAFGCNTCADWGVRQVRYRFL